jgi:hypothetical protein
MFEAMLYGWHITCIAGTLFSQIGERWHAFAQLGRNWLPC